MATPRGAFFRNGQLVQPDVAHTVPQPRALRLPPGDRHAGSAYFCEGRLVQGSNELDETTYIIGMHGLGDCIHQRATVRHFLGRGTVYLSTPWPCLYHDLVNRGLRLVKPNSALYTQAKNERVEAAAFVGRAPPVGGRFQTIRPGYLGGGVVEHGSIVDAMCHNLTTTDFSLPVPEAWRAAAREVLARAGISGPFAVVRPLTRRAEYPHLVERNPDHDAYLDICAAVRQRYPVISVADLTQPDIEAAVCEPEADLRLHRGVDELPTTTVIGLVSLAAVAVSAPGMMVPLAQAVGTPVVAVFGSYENQASFAAGYRLSPYLPIEPIEPAHCLGQTGTAKEINLAVAFRRLGDFLDRTSPGATCPRRTILPLAGAGAIRWDGIPDHLRGLFLSEMEVSSLVWLLRDERRVMEIGCQNGRTARVLLNSLPSIEEYIGVDLSPGAVPAHPAQRGEAPPVPGEFALGDPRFRLITRRRGSLDVEPFEVRWLDAVFIDGDHSRCGVERDTQLALASLRPGGLVIWHDDDDRRTVDVSEVLDGYVRAQRWPVRRVEGTKLAWMVT